MLGEQGRCRKAVDQSWGGGGGGGGGDAVELKYIGQSQNVKLT